MIKSLSLVLALIILSASTSESYTKVGRSSKKKNKSTMKMEYFPIKYNLVVKANLGGLIDSDDKFRFYTPDNKYFYGFGLAFEYHTNGRLAFGVHYDKLFYDFNYYAFDKKLLVQAYSVSTTYKFATKKTTIPIVTIQYGTAKPDITRASDSKVLKLGIGFIGHTTGKVNLKSLLYYQQFFSSDDLDRYLIDGKLNLIGLDIMVGLPL